MPSKITIIRDNNAPKIEISRQGRQIVINRKGTLINLPIATKSSLGGVIVGSNLTIDVHGVLNGQPGEGGAIWGDIGGDIEDQTNLGLVLATKATINDTPVAGQVAIWNDADGIKGDSKITWDGTTLLIDGDIKATGDIIAYYEP